jgi:hypothetical protein
VYAVDVKNIRIRDIENRWESLPLTLQAISRWAGVELHFRSINAALGLSFMVSAPVRENVLPTWWMTYGRDLFLVETGRLFGLSMRRVDVPSNGTCHFNEQARPLIAEALESNRPVICWRGWPDYHSHLWGAITEFDEGPFGFRGSTMWARGGLLPLAEAPCRVYIVDEVEPQSPNADELLRFAIGNIRRIVHNDLGPASEIVTGLDAYDRWIAWLKGDPNGGSDHSAHYQMARFVTHNRESACRFIEHYKDGLHEDLRPFLEAMHADCRGTIAALTTALDLKAVEVLHRTADGRDALAAGVHAARDFLEAQIRTIDHLAESLGVN